MYRRVISEPMEEKERKRGERVSDQKGSQNAGRGGAQEHNVPRPRAVWYIKKRNQGDQKSKKPRVGGLKKNRAYQEEAAEKKKGGRFHKDLGGGNKKKHGITAEGEGMRECG